MGMQQCVCSGCNYFGVRAFQERFGQTKSGAKGAITDIQDGHHAILALKTVRFFEIVWGS